MTEPHDVQVAIFGQNEAGRIAECLSSVSTALGGRRALITLVLNGTTDASEAAARATPLAHPLQICLIPHGDKANAINRFFHEIRAPARLYVFVDAYVTINAGAIDAIEARLAECLDANAASGIAANGRTSPQANRELLEKGGMLRGQLHAIRPGFLDRLVAAGIRLPIGTYWGDGLLGSLLCHDLDAMNQPWTDARVVGAEGAAFTIRALSPFRPGDIRRQFRRQVRQMRGRLQNAAIKRLVYAGGYAALPDDADDMVRADLVRHGPVPVPLSYRPFMALALLHLRRATRPDAARLEVRCTTIRTPADETH